MRFRLNLAASVAKREAELKAAAMAELERLCPRFLILLQATAGAPDRAIVGNGRTTFWEFKHATPNFVSHDNQELMAMRLNVQCHCRYVLWWENQGAAQRTMIVKPIDVHHRPNFVTIQAESSVAGFDHKWLAEQIYKAHYA